MNFVRRLCFPFLLMTLFPFPSHAMRVVPPYDYGSVIINNFSGKAGLPPVEFDHWRHRTMFTCRICHVDIGFAMEGGATKISASTNRNGFHCGACHNGKTIYRGKAVFASCSETAAKDDPGRCNRCHRLRDQTSREKEFKELMDKFPQRDAGNGVDWEEAEAKGLTKPVDFLEGVSIKRPPLKMEREISIESRGTWMSDVVFSHKKHALWNGCEVCHPEIFPSTKRGTVRYSMFQISNGEYCGVCHDKVAFPLLECGRCHTKPVR